MVVVGCFPCGPQIMYDVVTYGLRPPVPSHDQLLASEVPAPMSPGRMGAEGERNDSMFSMPPQQDDGLQTLNTSEPATTRSAPVVPTPFGAEAGAEAGGACLVW